MSGPFTFQERRVLLFVSLILALGLSYGLFKKTTGCNVCLVDIYSKNPPEAMDINAVSRDDLIKVPGIGPKGADDILAYRASHGAFKSLEELKNIPGLGKIKFELLEKYLKVLGR